MRQTEASRQRTDPSELGWMVTLGGAILFGFVVVITFGLQLSTPGALGVVATGVAVGGAALLVGALIGFLFGIPRTLQNDASAPLRLPDDADGAHSAEENVRYQVNTNLEQISDWLTKILVGVGLTQLSGLWKRLQSLADTLGPAFGGAPAGGGYFAVAALVYFATTGFLFGYLWTRLFLAGALARADLGMVLRRVEQRIEKQTEIDARALSLTYRYLDPDAESQEISVAELKRAVALASAGVKVQIYYQAHKVRSENWRDPSTKALMERTIPIFQALIDSDKEQRFHKNYGQLGFALKDRREPSWSQADEALSTAIRLRGDAEREGWHAYEFNRAVCRIAQDEAFAAGQPSKPASRAAILADLRVAASAGWLDQALAEAPVAEWLAANELSVQDLRSVDR